MAYELLSDPAIGDKYTRSEKDVMIMSLILHDGLKRGLKEEKYTRFDHPILMANYVLENKDKLKMSDEEVQLASSVIKHIWDLGLQIIKEMRSWKAKTKYQNFVHMCDYLASRKAILFNFDEENNITC